jgi:hypothetical protein
MSWGLGLSHVATSSYPQGSRSSSSEDHSSYAYDDCGCSERDCAYSNLKFGPTKLQRLFVLCLPLLLYFDFSSLDARFQRWRLILKKGGSLALPLINRASANYILCVLLADTVRMSGVAYFTITVYCQSLPAECRYWYVTFTERITVSPRKSSARIFIFCFYLVAVQPELTLYSQAAWPHWPHR